MTVQDFPERGSFPGAENKAMSTLAERFENLGDILKKSCYSP